MHKYLYIICQKYIGYLQGKFINVHLHQIFSICYVELHSLYAQNFLMFGNFEHPLSRRVNVQNSRLKDITNSTYKQIPSGQ